MKYIVWMVYGAILGAGVGLLFPIALVMMVKWSSSNDTNGIGTVGAIMMILTVPVGALAGLYLGAMRAKNGAWRGALSATSDFQATTLFQAMVLIKKFPNHRDKIAGLPTDEAVAAKRDYIANLRDMEASVQPNIPLLVSLGLASLIFYPLVLVPVLLLAKVLGTKWMLGNLLQRATHEWPEAAEEYHA